MHLRVLLVGFLHFVVGNLDELHEHHLNPEFADYIEQDARNESTESVKDERLVPDPTYPSLMEAVLQLWWSQRSIINSIRHEKDELRRVNLVHIDRLDDCIDNIDATIEEQIESLSIWNEPQKENLNPMNKTAVDELLEKWKSVDRMFSEYEIDGAEEISSRILNEMKSAQDDLLRRWVTIDRLSIEIKEQQAQKKEDEKYRRQDKKIASSS